MQENMCDYLTGSFHLSSELSRLRYLFCKHFYQVSVIIRTMATPTLTWRQ